MKTKEMDKLMAHFDKYFKQSDCQVLHPLSMTPHIDTLVYKPTSELPYWKLVSMGASDFRMPAKKPFLGDRNEYMMFVDAQEDLTDKETLDRYVMYLMEVAHYPIVNQCYITYGHSVEWKPEENEEMVCAFLEMPQIISVPNVLRCKLGLMKTAVCLQIVLLTKEETEKLLQIGPQQFSYYLYPENGSPRHFICELKRSEKF